MIWLVILSPLFVLITIVLYLNRKRGMNHPVDGNDNLENALAESDRAKRDAFINPGQGTGGDGGGPVA